MLACRSHKETFLRSFVASNTVSAQLCLRTCGDIRFAARDGQRFVAESKCLSRMYSKETFLRSFVASNTVSAQLCLRTCGDIRFAARDGQRFVAESKCLSRMYSK